VSCQGILGDYIECEWLLDTNAGNTICPDGCADLLSTQSGSIYVSGVTNKSRALSPRFGRELRGLHLKAGSIPLFFDNPAAEVVNQITPVPELDSPLAKSIVVCPYETKRRR
jgi:hypothetical protein